MPRGWRKAPHGPTPTLSGIEGLVRGGTLTERALSAPLALPLHVRVRLGGGRVDLAYGCGRSEARAVTSAAPSSVGGPSIATIGKRRRA